MAKVAKKDKRFVTVHSEGGLSDFSRVIKDTETGVLYLFHASGYGGGLTPLLAKDGKPLTWNNE
ncbi:MAG: DUF6440 family protein [Oscillospiraceae bacterium]|nr:DUF6440 family protein [Oscillospiraceae bacterium]